MLTTGFRGGSPLALLLVLAGCTASAPSPDPPIALPESFSASGDHERPQRWWRSFDDPHLNQLVDRALGANLSLRAAWQRLREARAVARTQGTERFPTLDATAEATERSGSAGGADSRQLADLDRLHGTLSGAATRKLCQRAYHLFGDARSERLAGISNGHLYNLRQGRTYTRQRGPVNATH